MAREDVMQGSGVSRPPRPSTPEPFGYEWSYNGLTWVLRPSGSVPSASPLSPRQLGPVASPSATSQVMAPRVSAADQLRAFRAELAAARTRILAQRALESTDMRPVLPPMSPPPSGRAPTTTTPPPTTTAPPTTTTPPTTTSGPPATSAPPSTTIAPTTTAPPTTTPAPAATTGSAIGAVRDAIQQSMGPAGASTDPADQTRYQDMFQATDNRVWYWDAQNEVWVAQRFDDVIQYTEVPLGYEDVAQQVEVAFGPDGKPLGTDAQGNPITRQIFVLDPLLKGKDPLEQARYQQELFGDPSLRDWQKAFNQQQRTGEGTEYYRPNEQYMTASTAWGQLVNMSVDNRAQLKADLVAIGLLDASDVTSAALLDDNFVSAYMGAIGLAQREDKKWYDWIAEQKQSPSGSVFTRNPGSRGPGGGGSGIQIRLTGSDDIRSIANQVAQQRLGRTFTTEELTRFTRAYQGQEEAFQRRYVAGDAVLEEAPSVQAAAETAIDSGTMSTESDLYAIGGALDMFTQIIGGR